ncbi:MAG TPA: hypothetical protein VM598_02205, partial [Bdellovibrionota bacterium]|nr:hypothetical protein [Bdellovibrionota bacterium]
MSPSPSRLRQVPFALLACAIALSGCELKRRQTSRTTFGFIERSVAPPVPADPSLSIDPSLAAVNGFVNTRTVALKLESDSTVTLWCLSEAQAERPKSS